MKCHIGLSLLVKGEHLNELTVNDPEAFLIGR